MVPPCTVEQAVCIPSPRSGFGLAAAHGVEGEADRTSDRANEILPSPTNDIFAQVHDEIKFDVKGGVEGVEEVPQKETFEESSHLVQSISSPEHSKQVKVGALINKAVCIKDSFYRERSKNDPYFYPLPFSRL